MAKTPLAYTLKGNRTTIVISTLSNSYIVLFVRRYNIYI